MRNRLVNTVHVAERKSKEEFGIRKTDMGMMQHVAERKSKEEFGIRKADMGMIKLGTGMKIMKTKDI